MKKTLLIGFVTMAAAFMTGCMNSPIALRSVVYNYNTKNNATTEGQAGATYENAPGDTSIEAPKTTQDSFKPNTNTKVLSDETGTSTQPVQPVQPEK